MQSMWIYWLLVFFHCKSTGLSAVVRAGMERNSSGIQVFKNPNSHCPLGPTSYGIYTVVLPSIDPFKVYCDEEIAGPGWTVIARRTNGELNFYRNWTEYKRGFGDVRGNFFIGLDKLHAITKLQSHELYVHLEDFEGNTRFARYDEFYIESENDLYRMSKLGAFTGDAGDSMKNSRNQKFSTYDRDNDQWENDNCALINMGPWWHNKCSDSKLFGMYLKGTVPGMPWKGMMWATYRPDYSFKAMQMMVRPKLSCLMDEL